MTTHFNEAILNKLIEFEISNTDTALLYLLSIYYGLDPSGIPDDVIKKVNLTKICERDFSKNVKANEQFPTKWNISLFVESEQPVDKNWDWIEKYREMFKEVGALGGRIDAKGDAKGTLTKMKKFFAENPHVRVADVMKATEIYLNQFKLGRQAPKFIKRADYFISKTLQGSPTSDLSMYVETLLKDRAKSQAGGENRFMNQVKSSS